MQITFGDSVVKSFQEKKSWKSIALVQLTPGHCNIRSDFYDRSVEKQSPSKDLEWFGDQEHDCQKVHSPHKFHRIILSSFDSHRSLDIGDLSGRFTFLLSDLLNHLHLSVLVQFSAEHCRTFAVAQHSLAAALSFILSHSSTPIVAYRLR